MKRAEEAGIPVPPLLYFKIATGYEYSAIASKKRSSLLSFGPQMTLALAGEPCRPSASPRLAKKVLFAYAHSIVDYSNGASVATLDMLEGSTAAGFNCQAFCAGKLDFQTCRRVEGQALRETERVEMGPRRVTLSGN